MCHHVALIGTWVSVGSGVYLVGGEVAEGTGQEAVHRGPPGPVASSADDDRRIVG